MPIPARRGSRPPAVVHRPPEPRGLRRQTTDDGHPTSIDQFIPGLYRPSAIVFDRRQPTPDTWNLERPACFEIVPTAARSGASRQICTARDCAIPRHRACARGSCDDALTCEYREIVRRSGFSSSAEPGAISSSRCQTTRTRSGEPDRVRNHCFWTSRALPEATRLKRKKAAEHAAGKVAAGKVAAGKIAAKKFAATQQHRSATADLVEPDGIEPTTSCLQSRRSPN
jgi:hypothetical protein